MSSGSAARFFAAIPWERYRGVRYCVVAYQHDGTWYNLAAQLVCSAQRPPPHWKHHGTVGKLQVVRGWLALDAARRVLEGLAGGELILGRWAVRMASSERNRFSWSDARHVPRSQTGIGWTSEFIDGSGPAIEDVFSRGHQEFAELGRRLPAASPRPFMNWNALEQFLGFSGTAMGLTNRHSTGVAVYMPTHARILSTDVEMKTGVLETTIESHETIEDLALVLVPEDASMEPTRIPAAQWKRHRGGRASIKTALFPDAGKINVQLVGRGELIDEAQTGSPPLATRAHAALDENCAWLRKLLGVDGKKVAADGFEVGVAALLNLAGIPAVHYGHDSGSHFPDLIAAVDDEHLIVAECTVDAPTLTKIQTPASRADAIRARASRGDGRHVNLLRVLFTPKSLNEIAPDIRSAAEGKLSVALVTRERLVELLDDVVRGEPQWKIWWKLVNWISRYGAVRV